MIPVLDAFEIEDASIVEILTWENNIVHVSRVSICNRMA
jgi:hypothetical protein